MKKWLLFTAVLLFIAGCAGAPTPIPDAQSSAAQLYAAKCGSCHSVPHPKRHTTEQWQHVLTLMNQRIQENNKPGLTADEKLTIQTYLGDHAR